MTKNDESPEAIARQLARYAHVRGVVILNPGGGSDDELPPSAAIRCAGTFDRIDELFKDSGGWGGGSPAASTAGFRVGWQGGSSSER